MVIVWFKPSDENVRLSWWFWDNYVQMQLFRMKLCQTICKIWSRLRQHVFCFKRAIKFQLVSFGLKTGIWILKYECWKCVLRVLTCDPGSECVNISQQERAFWARSWNRNHAASTFLKGLRRTFLLSTWKRVFSIWKYWSHMTNTVKKENNHTSEINKFSFSPK